MATQSPADWASVHGSVEELIAGGSTEGRFALVALTVERGAEPPCHRHHNEDEMIYVLSGDVLVQLGEARLTLNSGKAVFIPRGVDHGFAVLSDQTRLLIAFLPAGFEEFYREMTNIDAHDLDRLIAIAARYECEVTGPPVEGEGT